MPEEKSKESVQLQINIGNSAPEPYRLDYTYRCANCGMIGNPPRCFHGFGRSQLQIQPLGVRRVR